MSLLFIDSFDHYTNLEDKYDTVAITGGTAENSAVEGRFTPGAHHLYGAVGNAAGNGSITKALVSASQEMFFGFAFKYSDSPLGPRWLALDDAGLILGGIEIVGSTVNLLDAGALVVATFTTAVTVSVWQYIEVRVLSHATLGEIELHIGGALVGSAVAQNTRGTDIGKLFWDHNAETDDAWMDDLYILDAEGATNNTFIGDTRVTVLRPNANGLDNNFTPVGAGTNWEAVKDTLQDNDATYVEAGQVGAQEKYILKTFSDLGISPGTIYAAQVVNAAKKTDAGQLKYIDQMIIGGLEYDNGNAIIATSGTYKMTTMITDTDPSDSATWTEAKVAALGSGIEVTFREV